MAKGNRNAGELFRTLKLTLRLTETEMLRLRLSALGMKRSRSEIVRERIADLIGGSPPGGAGTPNSSTMHDCSVTGAEPASKGCQVSGNTGNTVGVQGGQGVHDILGIHPAE